MPRAYKRPAARRDLVEHYVYLAENAGEETADRFLRQADVTFALLAEQPEIGAALTLRAPQLAGLRKWRVRDFENFLILYLPRPTVRPSCA
jgi:toxin ParE1/3/4